VLRDRRLAVAAHREAVVRASIDAEHEPEAAVIDAILPRCSQFEVEALGPGKAW